MAGGTWTTQNKVRPGVYINFASDGGALGTMGEIGIAAFPTPLPWGNPGLIVLDAATYLDDALEKIGFHPEDPRIRHISVAMEHAVRVLLYRLGANGAAKASATVGNLTGTAKWGGPRGNDLMFSVQESLDEEGQYEVRTYLESEEVDVQTVEQIEDLQNNKFVDFSGSGEFEETAGAKFSGGTEGTPSGGEYSAAFAAFEAEEYNVLGLPVDDTPTKQLAVAYVRRLREEEGKKVRLVLHDYPAADYEGVTSLRNSYYDANGELIPPEHAIFRIAAMCASANVNESLTYSAIPGATDVYPKLTSAETIAALRNGELILTATNGRVVIEQDINTLTTFSPSKGRMFSKNRVLRVLDAIGNDIKRIFEQFYIGQVSNNADGRALLWNEIVTYMRNLEEIEAIQNFNSEDIVVLAGQEIDSVYVEAAIQPVDSVEKVYMKVRVR
ncbi:phage tail sheath protein [Xylanibacillus composti]|uniref:Phage tail sheath protein n=1 Tax=Xylanibacillus composti TaxID=1572762 RepID=A0A8J4H8A2_9BACL|nr:phage tail sheath family protein [Xylanibacillus composti]MDT9723767.1 phage tail sheath protein [Xylanibacillus composti]GIQ70763.1 hypothetical protein XYCOK13_35870 [Xylanibacillus composti]